MPTLTKPRLVQTEASLISSENKLLTSQTSSKFSKRHMGASKTSYGPFISAPQDTKENIAKLIQDEFIRTHSNRLSKLPSFLSTHMTRFNCSMSKTDVLAANQASLRSRADRSTAPPAKEYQPPHRAAYFREVASHRVTSDPPSRRQVEEALAELHERDDDKHLVNDQGSFCSTGRERSLTSVASRPGLAAHEYNPAFKSRAFYMRKLKAQNLVKNLPLEEPKEPVITQVIRGTLNVHIPSPNELFEKELGRMKQLYPQNYQID